MTPHDDEFYIGYEAEVPPLIRRQLRRVGVLLALTLVVAASVALVSHQRLQVSRFDFGRPRRVSGQLERRPYPVLTVDGRRTWLVGLGKHGAGDDLAGLPDGVVTLRGTPIARGAHTMLEVVAGSASASADGEGHGDASTASPEPRAVDDGADATLTGEIVDSKCFLGVMNPGESTVHRDCARLCLLGGIPPMLLVRGGLGEEALVSLVDRNGAAIGTGLADLAGQPVMVRGTLRRDTRGLVLAADVGSYRRVTR